MKEQAAAEARAVRDATFEQRRDDEYINGGDPIPTATPTGPTSQNLLAALGHWADWDLGVQQNDLGADRIAREQAGGDEQMTQSRLAANEIHNHYMVQRPDDLSKLKDQMTPFDKQLDLSNADARVAALDNLVQNLPSDASGEQTCAASSLLGAAILGGETKGTEGVAKLLDAMTKNASPETLKYFEGDKDKPGVLSDIRKKMASGEQLSVGDMHLIQRELYNELQENETKDAAAKAEKVKNDPSATEAEKAAAERAANNALDSGIQGDTLKKFLGNAPEFQKMMKDNEMGISFIQNDPDARRSNHAVLSIGHGREGGAYTVYDPQLRDDGQVITDGAELENYAKAESQYIGP